MSANPSRLLRTYVSRRSPWGPPWWIYGVAFGAANLIRNAVIIAGPGEIPALAGAASWLATALLVVLAVNAVAFVHRRTGPASTPPQPEPPPTGAPEPARATQLGARCS
jgi:membrane protein implicated in regulation of membrane protease activity